jgi:hypothetical protein
MSICLIHLEMAGFGDNVRKSLFAIEEVRYLGFCLAQTGIQLQHKKVLGLIRQEDWFSFVGRTESKTHLLH